MKVTEQIEPPQEETPEVKPPLDENHELATELFFKYRQATREELGRYNASVSRIQVVSLIMVLFYLF